MGLEDFYTRLQFSGQNCRLISITSGEPEIEKSKLAYNFAKVIASKGKNVLLIDADMDQMYLQKLTGYDEKVPGLGNILKRKLKPVDGIYATGIRNLFLMPVGNAVSDPELFSRNNLFHALLKGLLQVMDYIIVDAPAVAMEEECGSVINACSAVAITIKGGHLKESAAKNYIDTLRRSSTSFLGTVFLHDDKPEYALSFRRQEFFKMNWYWILLGFLIGANIPALIVVLIPTAKGILWKALLGALAGAAAGIVLLNQYFGQNDMIYTIDDVRNRLDCDILADITMNPEIGEENDSMEIEVTEKLESNADDTILE